MLKIRFLIMILNKQISGANISNITVDRLAPDFQPFSNLSCRSVISCVGWFDRKMSVKPRS